MNNVWVSCDWHLWNRKDDPQHKFRSISDIGRLSDNFATDIQVDDIFIHLGDLCDPERTDVTKLKSIIQSIPGFKILCRGNHDTMDDEYYVNLGFDVVTDVAKCHDIIFSHKPVKVNPDEINIHGHLHTQKLSTLGFNYINAYNSNYNDRPILVEELLDQGISQKPKDYIGSDLKHVEEKFEKYTSIDNYNTYTSVFDFTDKVGIYPVDECYLSSLSAETVSACDQINEIIFDDIADTRNWLADDDPEKQKKYTDDQEVVAESVILNHQDIYHNKDKFDSGEINLCFITGHSGSGKSTMGRDMQKSGIEHYELDDLQLIADHFSMDNLKEYGDLIYSYFKGPGKKFYVGKEWMTEQKPSPAEYEDKLYPEFVHYAMNYAKSHKDRKFVLEGVWLFNTKWFKPSEFKDYAFYIKGTSMFVSKFRADKRDASNDKDSSFAKRMTKDWKFYIIDEKNLQTFIKYFSDDLNESASKYKTEASSYDPPLEYSKLPTYLKRDPIHAWRAKTGIELIHKEPTDEELERIWTNWNLMDEKMKAKSDAKSMELFGIDNATHYQNLRSNVNEDAANLHNYTQDEKRATSEKYGLRVVGEYKETEDKNPPRTPEERAEERRKQREKALQKANKVKKKNARIRKLKKTFHIKDKPKNEDVGIDDIPGITDEKNFFDEYIAAFDFQNESSDTLEYGYYGYTKEMLIAVGTNTLQQHETDLLDRVDNKPKFNCETELKREIANRVKLIESLIKEYNNPDLRFKPGKCVNDGKNQGLLPGHLKSHISFLQGQYTRALKDRIAECEEIERERKARSMHENTHLIQPVENIKFVDYINESAKDDKLYPVYIMLMHSGTALANAIKTVTQSHFSHSSVSFDSSMYKMYSFGRKADMNPFIGGFKREDIRAPFFQERDIPYALYVVPCTKSEVDLMRKRLDYFEKNKTKFKYEFTGLFKNYFGIADNPEYRWFCSRFVADIINSGRPSSDPYVIEPSLMKPEDFQNTNFAIYVTGGMLSTYDQLFVDRVTNRILRAEKLRRAQEKQLESTNESAIYDLDPFNPYQDLALNYQLSMMDEAAFEGFYEYIKSFKVRFDKDGNPIISRREYDQLDQHFHQAVRNVKAYYKSGNYESMKEELCKVYYMIELINQYYLNPRVKNSIRTTADVKKEMLDLRSVMMNMFQQNLKLITVHEPKFNFQTYYDNSKYGKNTEVPKVVLTTISKTVVTLLK